jgi:ankyrin repeat protein
MLGDEFLTICKAGDAGAAQKALAADPSLARYVDPSGETPLMAALYRGHASVVQALVGSGAPLDLFAAAALGRRDVVEQALASAPQDLGKVSYDGWTPLHLAAFFGRDDVVTQLLERGAGVSALSTNRMANTPLHAALAGGRDEAAMRLLAAGADVRAVDAGGHTPLHIAAESGNVALVKALLARGADPHAVDSEDKTPLSRAAAKNHAAVVDAINLSH